MLVVVVGRLAQGDQIGCCGDLVRVLGCAASAGVLGMGGDDEKADANQDREYTRSSGKSDESHTTVLQPPRSGCFGNNTPMKIVPNGPW